MGSINLPSSARYVKRAASASSGVTYQPRLSQVVVSYQEVSGNTPVSYSTTLQKKFKVDPDDNQYELLAGSVKGTINDISFMETGGKVYEKAGGTSDTLGTQLGLIDYGNNEIVITDPDDRISSADTNIPLVVTDAMGVTGINPITECMFRTPGAPIRVESLTIYAEATNGDILTASSDATGAISGDEIKGDIIYDTGVCNLVFGKWVDDDSASQGEEWYNIEMVETTQVWQPCPVKSNSILINCTVISYLPLDSDLLGLNPVRLPLDGKVPIFRDAGIALIHDTKTSLFPSNVSDDQVVSTGRTNTEVIRLIDSTGAVIPEIDAGTPLYSVDHDAGQLTVINSNLLNNHANIPLTMVNRIEDMVLVSDVQVTGHMAIVNPVTHDYVAGEALVSSVLPSADLQARIENEFEQDSWTGVWSDTRIGDAPLASYDTVNYPITVLNVSSVEERFACIFTSSSTIQLVGENLGIIYEGTIDANIEINNPQSTGTYFFIDTRGWGAGWSTGDVFRFNSKGANYPLWFVRTTLQGPPTESTDNYVAEIRGDSS